MNNSVVLLPLSASESLLPNAFRPDFKPKVGLPETVTTSCFKRFKHGRSMSARVNASGWMLIRCQAG